MHQRATDPIVNASDGTLLARFASDGDQQAFSEIVRRHGPMVLRICTRMAGGDPHAADDAAQQVFLALAARARVLRTRASIAGWLYRTAWHVATRQRREQKVRTDHEQRAAARRACEIPPSAGAGDGLPFALVTSELSDALDRALGTLPETYRNALVLHHIGGHTVDETARLLEVPSGTAASWLSRGRPMLREQLEALGFVVTVDVVMAWLVLRSTDACPLAGSLVRLEEAIVGTGRKSAAAAAAAGSAGAGVAGATTPFGTAAAAVGGLATFLGVPRGVAAALILMTASSAAAAGGTAVVRNYDQISTSVRTAAVNFLTPKAEVARRDPPAPRPFVSSRTSNAFTLPEPAGAVILLSIGAVTCLRHRRRRRGVS